MESGSVIEYIDKQRILCAVVLEVKKQKLHLLTENNREVSLSPGRIAHRSRTSLDMTQGRDRMVDTLKSLALRRNDLRRKIDLRELWEVLNSEQEWIDLPTMTAFCFPDDPTSDHESAVVRAFFENRRYFKFNHDGFFPHSEAEVERLIAREREEARRKHLVEAGGAWLQEVLEGTIPPVEALNPADREAVARILRDYYIFGKESPDHILGKAICARAGAGTPDKFFDGLVRAGIMAVDENTELIREGVSVTFPEAVATAAATRSRRPATPEALGKRQDLTQLELMTIDGQSTLDFDDAVSIQDFGDHFLIGVHIVDVAHHVAQGDPIDAEALRRGSSIYMPDHKIPMLPPVMAEGLCSLRAGELRPAISTLIKVNPIGDILSYDVLASMVRIRHQRTYYDVNLMSEEDPDIIRLRDVATRFREHRLDQGAVQISLPDVNIWLDENGQVGVSKINRESPARMLVTELMIMANWLTARFLRDNGMPAIFRSQPDPKSRLYPRNEGTLFQNWMQRRLLSRFVLDTRSEKHSGLGLDAYVTATSPIRKYFDLVTQRQVRAVLGLEAPYSEEEVARIMQCLEPTMGAVSRVQQSRHQYWLLRYLEARVGEREEAIVLMRRKKNYQVLLMNYLVECDLPVTSGLNLKPEDVIEVTVQHVNARRGTLAVFYA
ncbi:MAG: RNB domain-containing ribonuclease [Desulfobacterales bacterium]|nr:RNB domain-containing ribonuclease [Desulfobacterales bacterium]